MSCPPQLRHRDNVASEFTRQAEARIDLREQDDALWFSYGWGLLVATCWEFGR